MAIRGLELDGILVLYQVHKPPHIDSDDRTRWHWTSGGTSIYRDEAQEAVKSGRIPRRFVSGSLNKSQRQAVLETLQRWLDGASSPIDVD